MLHERLRFQKVLKHSPLQLVFKQQDTNPYCICSGHLYTNCQSIPVQGNPIRAKTTINNLASCEIDFSANHPKMAAALMGLQLNDDPYQRVLHLSKIEERNQVKRVISALILPTVHQTYSAKHGLKNPIDLRLDSISIKSFDAIHQAALLCFPWLKFVSGIGIYLQSLEGQILMDTMIKLLKDNITSIPIHESLRVPLDSAEKATKVLQETWSGHLRVNFSTKVSIKNG